MYSYRSPVSIFLVGDIISEMSKSIDDSIVTTINQSIGVGVDKEELIKALNYDRNQYNRGYNDAKEELIKIGKWINRRVITESNSFDLCVCSNCNEEFSYDAETGVEMSSYKFCPNCGAKMELS